MEVEIWREVKAEPSENPAGIEYDEAGSREDNAVKREAATASGDLNSVAEDDLTGNVHCRIYKLEIIYSMHSENASGGVCVTCIFTCMPGENYHEHRQLRSLLLCLCDVIRALSFENYQYLVC